MSPHSSEQGLHAHLFRTLFISHGFELHAPGDPLNIHSSARPIVMDPRVERASTLQRSPLKPTDTQDLFEVVTHPQTGCVLSPAHNP